jgi:DNA excision repair protein ERCC-4
MTHAFPWPFLLLEFSTGKSFQLQATETISGELNPGSLIAQIIAIVMHFPTLRLVWSPSFLFTANVFTKLKIGREQPRIEPGGNEHVSIHDATAKQSSMHSKRAIEFLKDCPGVTAANLAAILKRVKSIREFVSLDDSEIIRIMGKRDGNLFIRFVNHQHS